MCWLSEGNLVDVRPDLFRLRSLQLTYRLQIRSMDCQLQLGRGDVNVSLAMFWGTVALDTEKHAGSLKLSQTPLVYLLGPF